MREFKYTRHIIDYFHLPANKAEDIEGQIKDGKGSEWDEEEHNTQTPPSPDRQTGLKHTPE